MSSLKRIFLAPHKEIALAKIRHPWLFSDAIQKPLDVHDGEICDVYFSNQKSFFGRGYYNSQSKIVVRLLTRKQEETIDQEFFANRFQSLQKIREQFIDTKHTNAYRLAFAESDELPGLIVDRYDHTYVIQIHTLGMDQLRDLVVEGLKKVFKPRSIYERSDVNVRLQDGLNDCPSQLLYGEKISGDIEIRENGMKFLVDVVHGQKTGFFLDQRENRKAIQFYVHGKSVLNCFSYTAGFSVYAAVAGAKEVTSVDISKNAIIAAERNFQANDLAGDQYTIKVADVFDYLDELKESDKKFDVIILDPPAFVKNKKSMDKGMSGYLQINETALKSLQTGGILVTSSCSSLVTDEVFQKMLSIASHHARCSLKVLEIRHQPPDHPFNLDFPEGKYLKFWMLQKG
jgi:23S rRNA (cytosine1962-C5)-methyltransferase